MRAGRTYIKIDGENNEIKGENMKILTPIKTIEELEERINILEWEEEGWNMGEENSVLMTKEMMIKEMIRAFIEYVKNNKGKRNE